MALTALVLFRAHVREALNRGFRRVKAGPFEFEWAEQLADVRKEADASAATLGNGLDPIAGAELTDELSELARSHPLAAIDEAHGRIEAELRRILETHGGVTEEMLRGAHAVKLARAAWGRQLITEETFNAVQGLTTLRNLSAHDQTGKFTPTRATAYIITADALLYAIRQNARSATRAGVQ